MNLYGWSLFPSEGPADLFSPGFIYIQEHQECTLTELARVYPCVTHAIQAALAPRTKHIKSPEFRGLIGERRLVLGNRVPEKGINVSSECPHEVPEAALPFLLTNSTFTVWGPGLPPV